MTEIQLQLSKQYSIPLAPSYPVTYKILEIFYGMGNYEKNTKITGIVMVCISLLTFFSNPNQGSIFLLLLGLSFIFLQKIYLHLSAALSFIGMSLFVKIVGDIKFTISETNITMVNKHFTLKNTWDQYKYISKDKFIILCKRIPIFTSLLQINDNDFTQQDWKSICTFVENRSASSMKINKRTRFAQILFISILICLSELVLMWLYILVTNNHERIMRGLEPNFDNTISYYMLTAFILPFIIYDTITVINFSIKKILVTDVMTFILFVLLVHLSS